LFLGKADACWFAHYLSREQIKPFMDKGERISRFVAELGAEGVDPTQADIAKHPYYRAFFWCWNEQRYYEAHDVLEQLWLKTDSGGADFFQGLDSGRRRLRSFAKEIRTSSARETQPASAASCALVSAGGKESIEFWSAISWIGCRRVLSTFARLRRSNRRVRLQNQPMVAGNRAETGIDVATALCSL
jgi:hypothetical protein